MASLLRVDAKRLYDSLQDLAKVGALPGGGLSRLALGDDEAKGRELVALWMREAGLAVTVDPIGNIFGLRAGTEDVAPVMAGSHIDTVAAAGPFDGCLGVLGALEAVRTLNDANVATRHPVVVAAFTNEEGARFQPDMMGSCVWTGRLPLEEAWASADRAGLTVRGELERTGWLGDAPCPGGPVAAYLELHVEQGPLLEAEGLQIGAVTGVQGISWQEVTITGRASHAGATPMDMRADAGFAAGAVIRFVRELALSVPGQRGTVGSISFHPDIINVIPDRARLTVDLRNPDDQRQAEAEGRLALFLGELAREEGVDIRTRRLARFSPQDFDERIVGLVERCARDLDLSVRRMPSGAGHDAQIMAQVCPAGMIFVPSKDGISHSIAEYTSPEECAAGADVLVNALLELAGTV
jgi:N-carbamoyl-L-amino-acid hydrolase